MRRVFSRNSLNVSIKFYGCTVMAHPLTSPYMSTWSMLDCNFFSLKILLEISYSWQVSDCTYVWFEKFPRKCHLQRYLSMLALNVNTTSVSFVIQEPLQWQRFGSLMPSRRALNPPPATRLYHALPFQIMAMDFETREMLWNVEIWNVALLQLKANGTV